MTEQEAIENIKALRDSEEIHEYFYADEFIESFDVAIKALEMISKRDELEDFNALENYMAEWNKYKVFHSDNPTEELHWMHALIRYYMVQYKLYKDSELSPKEVLNMKTTYEQYRALGTVEELRVDRDNNNGWISVENELPEKFDSVLVSCEGSVVGGTHEGEKCEFVATGYMFSKDHWQIQGHSDVKYIRVLAWQPLPEPYTPKGE